MSADGASWKVTLPCSKAEAEALTEDVPQLAQLDSPPVLMTSEPDPARPDEWRMDAYFSEEPGADMVALLRSLVPSAADIEPAVERVEECDWVTLSQAGLEPIRAGRFYVHTPAHRDSIPADAIALEIDEATAIPFEDRFDQVLAQLLQALEGTGLVMLHKPDGLDNVQHHHRFGEAREVDLKVCPRSRHGLGGSWRGPPHFVGGFLHCLGNRPNCLTASEAQPTQACRST